MTATETAAPETTAAAEPEPALTPDQLAMKARAERFGLQYNPKPAAAQKPRQNAEAPAKTEAASAPARKEKAGAIDRSAALGLSDEVLAKRAAKFGLPEKKAAAPAAAEETPAKTEKKGEVSP